MNKQPFILYSYVLDERGGGTSLGANFELQGIVNPYWVHLDATSPDTNHFLKHSMALPPHVVDGLLADESRPRCDVFDNGILIILRGVNLNPGANPEDMVSLRIWLEENRVITTRFRRIMAVEDIVHQLQEGVGPTSTGHLVARLGARLTERMTPLISQLEDEMGELEERLLESESHQEKDLNVLRSDLVRIRRLTIALRRFLSPQRMALVTLSNASADTPWMSQAVTGRFRDVTDRATRITEDLDEARDRCAVSQDEIAVRLSEKTNRTIYVLTLVSAVMLPLGFLTGLLGVNVAGIPGAEFPKAFWIFCGLLAAIVALELWFFRRKKWL